MKRILLIALFLFSWNVQAKSECESKIFRSWLQAQKQMTSPSDGTMKARSSSVTREYNLRTAAVSEFIDKYLSGQNCSHEFEKDLVDTKMRQEFVYTLQSQFLDKGIAKLQLSGGKTTQLLVAEVKARKNKVLLGIFQAPLLFKSTGHFGVQSPNESKAGFRRLTGTVFMDTEKIAPQDWMIIFVHELLHAVDKQLLNASILFTNKKQSSFELEARSFKKYHEWADKADAPEKLSKDERQELEEWLKIGMDRGLWAEHRAWYLTFEIYQEGLEDELWSKISWMEEILQQKGKDESLNSFIYRYLDERSENPKKGIFAKPLIQKMILQIREQARQKYKNQP